MIELLRNISSVGGVVVVLVVAIILLAFIPWVVIWALNTLFGISIVFGFKTWLAVFILASVFGNRLN